VSDAALISATVSTANVILTILIAGK